MAHENAKRIAKLHTMNRCIFRGTTMVDAAHIYPAGDFTSLADLAENIVAVSRDLHSTPDHACFDFKWVKGVRVSRPISERLWMALNMAVDEFKPTIRHKLALLQVACEERGIEFPEPERPADYYSLVRGTR